MWIIDKLGLNVRGPRRLVIIAATIVVVWVLFLDSHSILKRTVLHYKVAQTEDRNDELRAEIKQIKTDIKHAGDPDKVERVAREEYGMRREGETVYRVSEQ